MTRLLLMAALLAVIPTAEAGSVRSVTAPATVLALEHDSSVVAYAVGRAAGDCNRVYVWNLATRDVSKLGRKTTCEQTSTGNAIPAVSVAGKRVLWVHYIGGNIREWSLWTATTMKPAPIRLRFVSRDLDDPAPFVIGEGDDSTLGPLLPYAADRTVVALRANGSRAFSWSAPARVVGLSTRDGEVAVATHGGTVTVLDARGRVLRVESYETEVQQVRITGDALAVQRGRTLELRGGRTATWLLPVGVRLADADGDRAVLVGDGAIRSIDLRNGRVQRVASGLLARLEGARLSIGSGPTVSVR